MVNISKIRDWLIPRSTKKSTAKEYAKEKRQFQMAIGKPFITLRIELPKGFEDTKECFMDLQENQEFYEEVLDLVKKNLIYRSRKQKPETNK